MIGLDPRVHGTLVDRRGGGGQAGTFLGLPQAGDLAAPDADIVIFGADCAPPYGSVGAYCAGGPAAIQAGAAPYAGDTSRINFDLGGPILPPGVRAVEPDDLAPGAGRVAYAVPLDAVPGSSAAYSTIEQLRATVHNIPGADALVGGPDAVGHDTAVASARDEQVRHLGKVGDDVTALDILADADDHRMRMGTGSLASQHVAGGAGLRKRVRSCGLWAVFGRRPRPWGVQSQGAPYLEE